MRANHSTVACLLLAASTTLAFGQDAAAQSVGQFYTGKHITYIVGAGTGGGFDLYARTLAQFMPAHVPGKPTFVVQNMPPAGGITAANYMYNIATKDGSVISTVPSGVLLAEAMSPSQVQFSSADFGWIGTIATTTDVLAVMKKSGVNTLEDAKKKTAVLGATGPYALSAMEPGLTNALLGTKFHIIKGYSESGDTLNLAMEAGEIDGRTNQWASWQVLRPDWLEEKRLNFLVQFGPRAPELPDVPSFGELITDTQEKGIVNLLEVTQYVGRSVFTPPNVPADRLAALQQAFEDTMKDPDFIAKMKETKLDLLPRKAAETREVIQRAMANRDEVVSLIKSKIE